jgi:pantoate--beta-alanine ligase
MSVHHLLAGRKRREDKSLEIIRIPRIMQDTVNGHIIRGKTIGLVPTMGALHEGHLSLIRRARQENEITVVSIFVNPAQFGPSEDFQKYPRDIEGDADKLRKEEVDVLFMPVSSLMYPEGFLTRVEVEHISEKLCGAFRPVHFKGVATVVIKFFHIVKPIRAYFGQKDFQQTVVIKRMVRDLNMDIDIVICPTMRERDGLAMSSRNAHLDPTQRKASAVVYRALTEASGLVKSDIIDLTHIIRVMKERILNEPSVSSIDYAGAYDPETLNDLSEIKGDFLLAAAVRLGDTRIIDNILVNIKKER